MDSEFPPNSEASKRVTEDKNITRVTSGEVIRKKKSWRKRFQERLIAGDTKSVTRYVAFDVLLPMARDTIVEVVSQGVERLVFGESRRYRGRSTPPPSGPYGQVDYSRYSQPPSRWTSSQRAMSRQARARHDFDEIVIPSRIEADQVIEQLFEVISRYDTATVADLYELVGLASTHTDHKWGWTDIRGAGVTRSRDGFLLDLPDPIPLGN